MHRGGFGRAGAAPAAPAQLDRFDVAAVVGLAVLVLALYGTSAVADGWTSFDDPAYLWFVHRYSPATYLWSPELWQEITPSHFTPLLPLRYELDYAVHGLRLWPYALHNVVALAGATVTTYALLRQWVDRIPALLFAAVFVVNPSTVITVHESSTSHYVFGLVFAAAALLLFRRALRRDRLVDSLAASALLFLAMLSKEVYVSWVLFFALLGFNGGRLRHLVPPIVVTVAYFAWRTRMLDSAIGGYAPLSELTVPAVLKLLSGIVLAMTGSWTASALVIAMLVGAGAFALMRRKIDRRAIVAAVLACAAILGPLLPLAIFPGISEPGRLTFVIGWALAVGLALLFALFARDLRRHRVLWLLLAVVPMLALLANAWPIRAARSQTTARIAAEGRFLLDSRADAYVWLPAAPGWYTHSTEQLRTQAAPKGGGPVGIADFGETWRISAAPRQLWRYDGETAAMAPADDASARYERWCRSLGVREMSIDLDYSERTRVVRWRLRADGNAGRFTLLSPGPFNNVSLAADGATRIHRASLTEFRIRHEADGGTVAYSPVLSWAPSQKQLSWSGRSVAMPGCNRP